MMPADPQSLAGIRLTAEKLRAINDAPPPTNVSQLCSFLVNYYNKFLPQLATTLALLYSLLITKHILELGITMYTASNIQKRKSTLTFDCLLVHYWSAMLLHTG